ncbi:hypothetical protein C8R47DRAFT_1226638 [Mycena vitilis]|nr:hypothetical protein C8R47DRAFT_1226638 [Mycena vitilis]
MPDPSEPAAASTAPRRITFAQQTPAERDMTRAALGRSGQRRPEDGFRAPRASPLTKEDLYAQGRVPAIQPTPHPYQVCSICKNTKAHPVSNCYACIRVHLERSWECPSCQAVIRAPPYQHEAEQENIAGSFPCWSASTSVAYSWDGLTFPVAPEDSS